MNLLTGVWIPVRPVAGGEFRQITLQQLLCSPEPFLLTLPRDDMELAACQLLVSILQLIWPPEDVPQLIQRLSQPLTANAFAAGVADWADGFDLSHAEQPFMQVKGVEAKEITPMDKLLVGLTGSTNCAFVNQPGQGDALCAGCTAIALFNQAGNAPGFGGGFKSGLRGGTPVTTLIQQACLRTTLWANVLMQTQLDDHYPGWREQPRNAFTWQQPIISNSTIPAGSIGLARGLFWQPAHIELCPPTRGGRCSACGSLVEQRYAGFLKAKFNYTIDGFWLHPHSPYVQQNKKGNIERRYVGFSVLAPSWTQIGRLLISQQLNKDQEGRRPALVVEQGKLISGGRHLHLSIGGYRNNQAAILERRHDIMTFNQGWERHLDVIGEIVRIGLAGREALHKALYVYITGIRELDIIGAGVAIGNVTEQQYYRRSNTLITALLASADYDNPLPALVQFHQQLSTLCRQLLDAAVAPYEHLPKLVVAQAMARKTLNKHLSVTKPQGEYVDDATH